VKESPEAPYDETGKTYPQAIPIYSVDTEEQAKRLWSFCPLARDNQRRGITPFQVGLEGDIMDLRLDGENLWTAEDLTFDKQYPSRFLDKFIRGVF
jgi:hypothetical protein